MGKVYIVQGAVRIVQCVAQLYPVWVAVAPADSSMAPCWLDRTAAMDATRGRSQGQARVSRMLDMTADQTLQQRAAHH